MAVHLEFCSCAFIFNDLRRPLRLASVAGTLQDRLVAAFRSNRGQGVARTESNSNLRNAFEPNITTWLLVGQNDRAIRSGQHVLSKWKEWRRWKPESDSQCW
jgi:hypothetical protein